MKKLLCLVLLLVTCLLVGCYMSSVTKSTSSNSGNLSSNANIDNSQEKEITAKELEAQLSKQGVEIIATKYLVQDETFKALYPDMLQVIIENNTEYDIKNMVVAFVAWDKNNLPVKIKGDMSFLDGSYIQKVDYDEINLIPNATYGEGKGFSVDESCNIAKFKAIIVSYETFTGEEWENPLYYDWCRIYEGAKLSEE